MAKEHQAIVAVMMVMGSLVVLMILYNYYRRQSINPSDLGLMVFGTMLLGAGIWQNMEFSVGADGSISANVGGVTEQAQAVGDVAAQLNRELFDLGERLEGLEGALAALQPVDEMADAIHAEEAPVGDSIEVPTSAVGVTELPAPVVEARDGAAVAPRSFDPAEYTILVFYRDHRRREARELTKKLLKAGFRASATASDLSEVKDAASGSSRLLITPRGEILRGEISGLLPAPLSARESTSLKRGDLQILLY